MTTKDLVLRFLAYLIQGDGNFHKHAYTLCLESFYKDDLNILIKTLNTKLESEKIQFRDVPHKFIRDRITNEQRQGYRDVCVIKDGSRRLSALVAPYIFDSYSHKVVKADRTKCLDSKTIES